MMIACLISISLGWTVNEELTTDRSLLPLAQLASIIEPDDAPPSPRTAEPAMPPRAGSRRAGGTSPGTPAPREIGPASVPANLVPPELRVIPLKHAYPAAVEDMINAAFQGRVVFPDDRTNSLIYLGPPGLAEKVVNMVEQIDIPSTNSAAEERLTVQAIRHRRAEEVASFLHGTMASRRLRIAADPGSSSLVLAGPEADIRTAQQAIEKLDQESPPAQYEFSYFAARQTPDPEGDRTMLPTPEDLRNVAGELARFGQVEFLGRLTATGTQDQKFSVEGGMGQHARVYVDCNVIASPADGPAKIDVMSKVEMKDMNGKAGPTFTLKTMVVVPRGGYVVVGSAPAGWDPGESAILVLHIRP